MSAELFKAMTKCDMVQRALLRLGAGPSRYHLRQGAADLREPADHAGPGARRQRPRAWCHLEGTLAGAVGHCRERGDRAGIRIHGVLWHVGPEGHPGEIVAVLNQGVNEVLVDPKLKARLAERGGVPTPMTPETYGRLIAEATEKWRKVVEFAGISVE
jgi:hypothetical protein